MSKDFPYARAVHFIHELGGPRAVVIKLTGIAVLKLGIDITYMIIKSKKENKMKAEIEGLRVKNAKLEAENSQLKEEKAAVEALHEEDACENNQNEPSSVEPQLTELDVTIDEAGREVHAFVDRKGSITKIIIPREEDIIPRDEVFCPGCLHELAKEDNCWKCPNCGFSISQEDLDNSGGLHTKGDALDYREEFGVG